MHDAKWKSSFRRKLLKWFDENQRELPWRRNKTAYRIWISEIMLQQTQVATVVGYYARFLKRFPSVAQLAEAEEADVLKLWEGLGYYRRARQLHAAARVIVDQHNGRFPEDFKSVLALPGIGRYSAGAILSISGDHRLPILEGNTIRLLARLSAMRSDPRTTDNQKALWEFSEDLLPRKRCGDFNQSLMELGSELCSPQRPQCPVCPVVNLCPTAIQGLQDQIPIASRKIKYESLNEAVIIVQKGNKYLVRQCGPGERWQNLWDFPRYEISKGRDWDQAAQQLSDNLKQQTGLTAMVQRSSRQLKHAVTRYRITLECCHAENVTGRLKRSTETLKWMTLAEISQTPMSITGRTIAKSLAK